MDFLPNPPALRGYTDDIYFISAFEDMQIVEQISAVLRQFQYKVSSTFEQNTDAQNAEVDYEHKIHTSAMIAPILSEHSVTPKFNQQLGVANSKQKHILPVIVSKMGESFHKQYSRLFWKSPISGVNLTSHKIGNKISNQFKNIFSFKSGKNPEIVVFTAVYPKELQIWREFPLSVYVHTRSRQDKEELRRKVESQYDKSQGILGNSSKEADVSIMRGSQLTVYPQFSEDVLVYPEFQPLTWNSRIDEVTFTITPRERDLEVITGSVIVHLGYTPVAQIPIYISVNPRALEEYEIQQQTINQMKQIFVSYSSKDKEIVDEIIETAKLLESSIKILYDHEILRSGDFWWDKILNNIQASDGLQLMWSENSQGSKWVAQEYTFAHKLLKKIFPVHVDNPPVAPPNLLKHLQFSKRIDFIKLLKKNTP